MRTLYKAVISTIIGIFMYATVFHFVFSLAGCGPNLPSDTVHTAIPDTTHYVEYGIRRRTGSYCVVAIQGCEYIIFRAATGDPSITHKGNCKNPIHLRK